MKAAVCQFSLTLKNFPRKVAEEGRARCRAVPNPLGIYATNQSERKTKKNPNDGPRKQAFYMELAHTQTHVHERSIAVGQQQSDTHRPWIGALISHDVTMKDEMNSNL